jgi:hypothetical protein
VPQVLHELSVKQRSLHESLKKQTTPDRVTYLQEQFLKHNLVAEPDMVVSGRGRTCHCGVGVIEGESIVDAIDRLQEIDPSAKRITVVREGMTDAFLTLVRRLDAIRRIWICSPWVSLTTERLRNLAIGVERARRDTGFVPEISVVTRPVAEQPLADKNETLAYFSRVNAVIRYKRNLHSKLYIVETASSPAQRQAFVGSENFTKPRFQEVGIRVNNDNQLIDDLVRYFLALT